MKIISYWKLQWFGKYMVGCYTLYSFYNAFTLLAEGPLSPSPISKATF